MQFIIITTIITTTVIYFIAAKRISIIISPPLRVMLIMRILRGCLRKRFRTAIIIIIYQ